MKVASDTANPGAVPPAGAARPPRHGRRLARTVGRVLGGLLLALLFALIAARLYLSDARLRDLAIEFVHGKSGATMELGELHVSLFTGIEVKGLRIGPLAGFTKDIVAFDRLALRWSLWELVTLTVAVDELALEQPRLTLEEQPEGKNVDLLLAKLFPAAPPPALPTTPTPPEATPSEPAPPPEKKPLAQPRLPLRVEVRRIALVDAQVSVVQPETILTLDRVNVAGHFFGQGLALDLDLWFGLGAPDQSGEPSRVTLVRGGKAAADLDGEQRFGLHVRSSGFGDIALEVLLDALTHVRKPMALPALAAHGRLAVTTNLLAQTVTVSECAWRIGEKSDVELTMALGDILAAAPRVDLRTLALHLDLDELAPLIANVAPRTPVGGRLEIVGSPFSSDLESLKRKVPPETTLTFAFERFLAKLPTTAVAGLDGTVTVTTRSSDADVAMALQIGSGEYGPYRGNAITLDMQVHTPIAPFVGGEPEGTLTTLMNMAMRDAQMPGMSARGVKIKLDAQTPVAMLLGKSSGEALLAKVGLTAAQAETGGSIADGVDLDMTARAFDLLGEVLWTHLDLALARVHQTLGKDTLTLDTVGLALTLTRRRDDYHFESFDFTVGPLVDVTLAGAVLAYKSAAPRFEKFALRIGVPDLGALLATVPATMKPPMEVAGGMRMALDVDGVVPQRELGLQAQAPKVDLEHAWAPGMQAYAAFLGDWAARFTAGMPFTAAMQFWLDKVALRDAKNELSGLDIAALFEMTSHGPHAKLEVNIGEVKRPSEARAAHVGFEGTLAGDAVRLAFDAGAAELKDPSLVAPLVAARAMGEAHYRLGGDFLVDRFSFDAGSLGASVTGDALIARPLQLAQTRGWQLADLPGVEVAVRYALGLKRPLEATAMTVDGAKLGGSIGVTGTLRVADGLIAIAGTLDSQDFSYATGPTSVDGMSGSLPFDLRLVTGKRDDATVVARNLTLGGGLMSLLTSADDIRSRPARPAYFDRLRSYRKQSGLAIRAIHDYPYDITDFRLDGRLEQGMLLADHMSMHMLGGDIVGNLGFQLGRDASMRGDMAFQISGLDASTFKELNLTPGPDSELNTDMRLGFLFGPHQRDLELTMNVTKIGAETFDRLLQFLDPQGKKSDIQSTRANLSWVRIDQLAIWIRYENLNMDVAYTTRLGIPGTNIGYHPIKRDLLRRYSVSEYLDVKLQPAIDKALAPSLGWAYVQ